MKQREPFTPTGWECIDKLFIETEQALKEFETAKHKLEQAQKGYMLKKTTIKTKLKRTKGAHELF